MVKNDSPFCFTFQYVIAALGVGTAGFYYCMFGHKPQIRHYYADRADERRS